jgi:2-dehydropantoate 2-reductase
MSTLAIIGPGAIGGTLAAWLAQNARHQVIVAARTGFDSLEVETPYGVLRASPTVLTDPSQARRFGDVVDWVLVTTKAYDAAGAAAWLKELRRDNTRVAILQNGVEHVERFAPYVPVSQLLPAMIDCPAERLSPGRIRQRGDGRIVVPDSDAGRAFAELFAGTRIDVTTNADFKTQIWRKLCVNSAGAISAVLLKPGIVHHDGVAEIMRAVIRECVAVGRAEGAKLDDDIVESVIAGYRKAPRDSINSLHADRIAGRPMEIDARNGVIVRLGRKHGIPTPMNAMIVALLEAAQT